MSEQMKMLIAYDGSDCANAALEDLHRAGLPPDAEVLILSVADVFLPPSSSPAPTLPADVPIVVQRAWAQATHAVDEARALAQHARAQLVTAFPTWEVRAEACADAPAWAVVKQADTWHPDLIVVGSHGRSAMSRLVLGSVSQKILTEARCSVRVGRKPPPRQPRPLCACSSGWMARPMPPPPCVQWPHACGRRSAVRLVTALDARMCTALAFLRLPGQTGMERGETDESGWMSETLDAMAAPLYERGLAVSSDDYSR